MKYEWCEDCGRQYLGACPCTSPAASNQEEENPLRPVPGFAMPPVEVQEQILAYGEEPAQVYEVRIDDQIFWNEEDDWYRRHVDASREKIRVDRRTTALLFRIKVVEKERREAEERADAMQNRNMELVRQIECFEIINPRLQEDRDHWKAKCALMEQSGEQLASQCEAIVEEYDNDPTMTDHECGQAHRWVGMADRAAQKYRTALDKAQEQKEDGK